MAISWVEPSLGLSPPRLLLMVTAPSRWLQCWLGDHNRQLLAAVWIGIGSAIAWSILIP